MNLLIYVYLLWSFISWSHAAKSELPSTSELKLLLNSTRPLRSYKEIKSSRSLLPKSTLKRSEALLSGGEGWGIGSDPPGATAPFGFVRVWPDTCLPGPGAGTWLPPWHFAGYHVDDTEIRVFSHMHCNGCGSVSLGAGAVMPVDEVPSAENIVYYGYRSVFSHGDEVAVPGYYAVSLDTYNIRVELTASRLVAVHRYRYRNPHATHGTILFPQSMSLSSYTNEASVSVDVAKAAVSGYVNANDVKLYFAARFSTLVSSCGTWKDKQIRANASTISGDDGKHQIGAYATVELDATRTVVMVYAVSLVSVEQAQTNMRAILSDSETPSAVTFDQVLDSTQSSWDAQLSRANVTFADDQPRRLRTMFYTAMYHSLQTPTNYLEESNVYVGMDVKTHDGKRAYYSDLSIWDVHRTQMPWLALFAPSVAADVANSLVLMYEQGGSLPRWPEAYRYRCSMIGQHANVILADFVARNITNFDMSKALDGMIQAVTKKQNHCSLFLFDEWRSLGFVPDDRGHAKTCSLTLAWAYDDAVTASMARRLGRSGVAEQLEKSAKNYRHLYQAQHRFFCPKSTGGVFDCPWVECEYNERYVEGDALHYKWFVPHDVDGLIALFPSTETFVSDLAFFMDESWKDPLNALPNCFYWAGNEPDLLAPFLFNFAHRADLTSYNVRKLVLGRYDATPAGIPGNDDFGTMSAWLHFAMLGFYPLAGTSKYLLVAPTVREAIIRMEDGFYVTVRAPNQCLECVYIDEVRLNGESIDFKATQGMIEHAQLIGRNSTLLFQLSRDPPSRA